MGRSARDAQRAWCEWTPTLIVIGVCVALALGGDAVRQWCRYDRLGLEAGQLWRLVTGHLVHLGYSHLSWDLGSLILIRLIVGTALSMRAWCLAFGASIVAIDLGLYFLSPEVSWYVGLSGALHGLFVAGAIALFRQFRGLAIAMLIGIVAKLAWEQVLGPLPSAEWASGGPVVAVAHLYGAIGGAVFGMGWLIHRRRAGSRSSAGC